MEFPHGSLDQDLDAYLRVLYNHEPTLDFENEGNELQGALASPVIMLGPHGHAFSTNRKPVRISFQFESNLFLFSVTNKCIHQTPFQNFRFELSFPSHTTMKFGLALDQVSVLLCGKAPLQKAKQLVGSGWRHHSYR